MMHHPLEKVLEWHGEGRPCCLLVVAATEGSGPGTEGSMMAVAEGETCGTVGGGSMEEDLIRRALAKLSRRDEDREIVRHVHSPDQESSSGMICSGSQLTLLLPVTVEVARAAAEARHMLEMGATGRLRITGTDISVEEDLPRERHRFEQHGDTWEYSGSLGIPDTVYIIGGGHVGQALAGLLASLPFRPVILDERPPGPGHETPQCEWIVAEWTRAHEHILPGDQSWVAVMTPGHGEDETVIRSLHGKKLRYLGLMASTAKKAEIWSRLMKDGVDREFLDAIRCPIGVSIGSRLPDEIAVSVAAELLGIRSGVLP